MNFAPIQSDSASPNSASSPPVKNRGGREPDLVGAAVVSGPPRVLPEVFFREYLRQEQLRAYRSVAYLTLAVLSVDSASRTAEMDLYRLAQMLQALVRETDVLGWYGKGAIAILMTDTDSRGGEECVRRLLSQTKQFSVRCETHVSSTLSIDTSRGRGDHHPRWPQMSGPFAVIRAPVSMSKNSALAVKRGLDIVGSLIGMVALAPVLLAVALAIKATSPGPVIFRQVRLGRGGAPFVFYKFRSMRVNSGDDLHKDYVQKLIRGHSSELNHGDSERPFYKLKSDPRITRVGAFLRKSSMDELPQLVNILRGEMSLVGPRPPVPYEVEAYSAWHLRRILEVKPGLTGLWQVEGRSVVGFDDMVRLDLHYARHWSLLLDLKILLKTVKVVFQGKGAG